MEFVAKKRSRPVVPIISLIDILAILLIFVVATSTFRDKRESMKITLPKSRNLAAPVTSARDVAELRVRSEEEMMLDTEPISLETLSATLAALRQQNPDQRLELLLDESIPFGTVVRVWDSLTSAGFQIRKVPVRMQTSSPTKPSEPRDP